MRSPITTRHQDLAWLVGGQPVNIEKMPPDQAVGLLTTRLAGAPDEADQARLIELASYLGGWPLLLNLAGAYLGKLTQVDSKPLAVAITRLRRRLAQRGFTDLDVTDASKREQAVSLTLNASLAELGRWRDRFLELAIFPQAVAIPFSTLARLWRQTAGLDDFEAEDARNAIRQLSLFTHYDPHQETVRLHDIIRHYLIAQHPSLPTLHTHFLTAYRPPSSLWSLLSPTNPTSGITWPTTWPRPGGTKNYRHPDRPGLPGGQEPRPDCRSGGGRPPARAGALCGRPDPAHVEPPLHQRGAFTGSL